MSEWKSFHSKRREVVMPKIARMVVRDEKAVYHVMSRTALDRYPFKVVDKGDFVIIIRNYGGLYFTDVLGFCFTPLNSLRCNVLHLCTAR
jgi:hypothetical protein